MSATFFLAIFMSSERSSNFLMRWTYFQLISALLHVSKVERNSCRFFYMPKGVDHKIFTILRTLMATSLQCGANSTAHDKKHLTTHAPILFWFAFPNFFTNLNSSCVSFLPYFFFCLASIRNCYFLNQTPSKPRGFTSEVSRTQHPADHGPFPSHSESLATIMPGSRGPHWHARHGSECPARASISDATADRLYPNNVL